MTTFKVSIGIKGELATKIDIETETKSDAKYQAIKIIKDELRDWEKLPGTKITVHEVEKIPEFKGF